MPTILSCFWRRKKSRQKERAIAVGRIPIQENTVLIIVIIIIITSTEDTREMVFLFQQLSVALQRGIAFAFLATFDAVWYTVIMIFVFAYFNFNACSFVLVAKN